MLELSAISYRPMYHRYKSTRVTAFQQFQQFQPAVAFRPFNEPPVISARSSLLFTNGEKKKWKKGENRAPFG